MTRRGSACFDCDHAEIDDGLPAPTFAPRRAGQRQQPGSSASNQAAKHQRTGTNRTAAPPPGAIRIASRSADVTLRCSMTIERGLVR